MNSMLQRPRRNRASNALRDMLQETELRPQDLVWPVFIMEGVNKREEIKTLPGVYRQSLDVLAEALPALMKKGLRSIALFPVINDSQKDSTASEALNPEGFLPKSVRSLKSKFPELLIITDVALDPYSSDGHDGLVKDGKILNDASLEVLAGQALVQAQAGADLVAPSDMMDGRVGYIRKTLDKHGFENVGILSYCAKYASSFYGPFRDALSSAPRFGDKKTYQMNPANTVEALRELELDTLEGADIVMVKPALAYLDVIQAFKQNSSLPIAAYQVSGEYAMIEFAALNGALDRKRAVFETLLSMKRAGASMIFTYYAPLF